MPNQPHRRPLGFFPTPLSELPALTRMLGGPRIMIKRDDLTGLALGGNKTRKLEYLIGDAIARGCDTVVTGGAAQSNHCRQTAAAAAMCGLECHLVISGSGDEPPQGNILLDHLLGAHIHRSGALRKGERIPELVSRLSEGGQRPYVIPYGGSNAIGALGFVEAVHELNRQMLAQEVPISHILFASSSGGTQAGLIVGKAATDAQYDIVGIEIDKGESGDAPFRSQVEVLAAHTAELIEVPMPDVADHVHLRSEYLGAGYGVVGDREREAIDLLARTEGLLLDPVYTGRAMGGLIDMIRQREFGPHDTVLFWHTGGTPALFAHAQSRAMAR